MVGEVGGDGNRIGLGESAAPRGGRRFADAPQAQPFAGFMLTFGGRANFELMRVA